MSAENGKVEDLLPEGMKLVVEIASYMRSYFATLVYKRPPCAPPEHWSNGLAADAQCIVKCIVRAQGNPVNVDWDAEHYADQLLPTERGSSETRESAWRRAFPPPKNIQLESGLKSVENPMTVIDIHGRVLVWYLPKALSPDRQEKFFNATKLLDTLFGKGRHADSRRKHKHASINSGWLELSPGRCKPNCEGPDFGLEVSEHLRILHEGGAGPSWLTEARESVALLSASLSILHQGLFSAGVQCMFTMKENEPEASVRSVLDHWPSVFNMIEVVSNCEMPRHRDPETRPEWYNLMCASGTYSQADFVLDSLGMSFDYAPGSLVALSGKLTSYSIPKCGTDSVWYAFYMRDSLHKRFRIENPSWRKHKQFLFDTQ